jgi:hypothetical protein
MWATEVEGHLRETERVALDRASFAKIFVRCWDDRSQRTELIVRAFRYCGLYPCSNPTTAADFAKTKAFSALLVSSSSSSSSDEEDNPSSSTPSAEPMTALRTILPSPLKDTNPCHTRPHTSWITSPEFMEVKSARRRLNDGPSTSSSLAPSAKPASVPAAAKASSLPRKSGKQPVVTKSPILARPRSTKTDSEEESCSVCLTRWSDFVAENPKEEWLVCPKCSKWACEECFGSRYCFNCE